MRIVDPDHLFQRAWDDREGFCAAIRTQTKGNVFDARLDFRKPSSADPCDRPE